MLNGLQIISSQAHLNIKMPGNAAAYNKYWTDLTSWEILPLKDNTKLLMYFPEEDPPSLALYESGVDTSMMIPGIGS